MGKKTWARTKPLGVPFAASTDRCQALPSLCSHFLPTTLWKRSL